MEHSDANERLLLFPVQPLYRLQPRSIELLSVDMEFSSNYSLVLTKFLRLDLAFDEKFLRKLIF